MTRHQLFEGLSKRYADSARKAAWLCCRRTPLLMDGGIENSLGKLWRTFSVVTSQAKLASRCLNMGFGPPLSELWAEMVGQLVR